VLIAPVPPIGLGAPPEAIAFLEAIAVDEPARRAGLAARYGARHTAGWADHKLRRWAESARPEACRAYVAMIAAGGVRGAPPADLPVLAVLGGEDAEPFTEPTVRRGLAHLRLEVAVLASAGHYPMEETPVALATVIQRFLAAPAAPGTASASP
jgi:pimeloyl-ACP methyl ester carboxylesterase